MRRGLTFWNFNILYEYYEKKTKKALGGAEKREKGARRRRKHGKGARRRR